GELRSPLSPQLDEALVAAVLLLAGDVAVQLVQLLSILLTAGLLVAWGGWDRSRRAGWIAAAAYLGSPIVIHLGTSAYVEAGLTLFTTAALYPLWRYLRSGARGWLAPAPFFPASAPDAQSLGLFFLATVVLLVAFSPARAGEAGSMGRPAARRLADLLLFSVVALAVLLPGYGRILYYTGNPVFPYLPRLFGHS